MHIGIVRAIRGLENGGTGEVRSQNLIWVVKHILVNSCQYVNDFYQKVAAELVIFTNDVKKS